MLAAESLEGTTVRMPTSYRPEPTLASVLPSANRRVTWAPVTLVPPLHCAHVALTLEPERLKVTASPASPLMLAPVPLREKAPPPEARALVVTVEEVVSDSRLTTRVMLSVAGATVAPE